MKSFVLPSILTLSLFLLTSCGGNNPEAPLPENTNTSTSTEQRGETFISEDIPPQEGVETGTAVSSEIIPTIQNNSDILPKDSNRPADK